MATKLDGQLTRETSAIECPVDHGFCESVPGTPEERAEVGCGRTSYDCCNAAFVCKICGERYYSAVEAPDIGY